MKAVIYTRYSPRRNGDNCASCATQLDYCRKWCDLHNAEVIGVFSDEGLSGARMDNRPGLIDALQAVCKNKCVLVVYALSRLSRSLRETLDIAERLDKAGADLASLHEHVDTTTPTGKLIFSVMGALNQFEREQTAERTSEAMRRLQACGRRMSKLPPFGWQIDPDDPDGLIPNEDERKIIDFIVKQQKAGLGYSAIASAMAKKGYYFRSGKNHHHQVKMVLKRAGLV